MRRIFVATVLLLMAFSPVLPAQAQGEPPDQPAPPPTRLVIPKIGLDTPITVTGWTATPLGTTWEVPDDSAGWLSTSVSPGRGGNVVLIGHHNVEGKVFRDLKNLAVNDELTVYVADKAFDYLVSKRLILREAFATKEQRLANARWIGPFPDEQVTLVTCYPAWTNTHRLIIVAQPVGAHQGLVKE